MKRSDCRKMQGRREAVRAPSRRGSAIVIVTSLIAIMFVACVGFTIMMRTERAASANYRHMVGARQMLSSGLGQALSDINCTMTNYPAGKTWYYPPWYGQTNVLLCYATNRSSATPVPTNYDGVIYSLDPTVATGTPARILSAAAMQYVPKDLQKSVELSQPEWIAVSANGQVVGRYAYIALDVSGLLDANNVGGSPRANGTSPAEMQVSGGSPIVDLIGSLPSDRTNAVRFESLPDLAANAPNSIDPTRLNTFETFSYAPMEYAPDGYPKLNVSLLTAAGLQSLAPGVFPSQTVSNRLLSIFLNTSMRMPAITANTFLNRFIPTLLDFTSSANYPLGYNTAGTIPAYPKVKPLPMIQSMYWAPAMTYTSWITNNNPYGDIPADTNSYVFGTFQTKNVFLVGVYCPNASDASAANFKPSTYQVAIQYGLTNTVPSFSAGPAVQGSPTVSAKLQGAITSLLPPQTAACSNLTLSPFGAYNYSPPGFAFLAGATTVAPWAFTNCTNTNNPLQLSVGKNIANNRYFSTLPLTTNNLTNGYCSYSVYMRAKLTRLSDSSTLDQVPGDWTTPGLGVQIDCTNVFLTNSAVSFNPKLFTTTNSLCAFWAEALDPRFNWDTSGTTYFGVPQWVSENTMRNATNPASSTYVWSGATNLLPKQPILTGWGAGFSIMNWSPSINASEPILMHLLFKNTASMARSNQTCCLPLIFDNAGWRSNSVSGAVPYSDYTLCGPRPPNTVFSRNGPLLSVGDLGFIPISYWYSLRLYDHQDLHTFNMVPGNGGTNYFPVYDWFTANPNTPPTIQRGLLNLNSQSLGPFYAALTNMPVTDYASYTSLLTSVSLSNTITFIQDMTYTNPLTSVAQIGAFPWFTNTLAGSAAGFFSNEYDRASVIRNATSLFTTRQQIFTIIVRAEGFASTFGYTDAGHGHTLGSAEAVFQVWRDPKPDANGNHPCFIRLYKILSQ